ncbi:uncharacterized protein LOC110713763 [Chenopodium quinoa]|uniref:uncharacterized protein LOC110713763 n=1 Tax=Chenopodium quinoa TaxID=63459 RepID=UPI000B78ABFF|nr:uncharacterized protein LOC110713763 [Chenopodium quinoa]
MDLEETFATLNKYSFKLNPKKCVFRVSYGKFLGFLISERGIDANPEKVEAVLNLLEPKSIKDIMRLTGNREFKWGTKEKEAFEGIKEHLTKLPTMISLELTEKLQLYILAPIQTIAAALLVERQKQQRPIYFVSHVLTEAEQRYPLVEKLAFAVVTAARKLKPYFDAHIIEVLTNHPLEKALQKMDASGRLLKWEIDLSEYEFEVKPRAAIKAQALADFTVEASYEEKEDDVGVWKVEVDGSSAQTGSGAGVIMTSPKGNVFEYTIKFKFKASNNEAEYEATLADLRMSLAAGARKVHLQTTWAYEIREATMMKYVTKVKELAAQLVHFQIDLVPRAGNSQADALSKLASSTLESLIRIMMVEVLEESSIAEKEQVNCVRSQRAWFSDILAYKLQGSLPDDEAQTKKVKKDANWYVVMNGELNKKGFSKPLLRCILEWEQEGIMEEAHFGICANHIGGKALGV